MTENNKLNWIANFIWGIADDVLRDLYVRGKYRDVILPMTVLRRLDSLLEPTKQAIIHRAVTRGLDPNIHLKPSGVEWLGDVPEHWEVARLKTVLSRPLRNGLFKKKDAFGNGVPLVNVTNIYRENFQIDPVSLEKVQSTPDEIRTYNVQSGDIFFVRSSLKLEGTGRSAVAIDCEPTSVFECHLVQGRPNRQRVNPRFLIVLLNSFALRHYLISRANAVTMATVAQNALASSPVLIPQLSEQEIILRKIDKDCEQVDSAINHTQREIALLREDRTRLIADVVTGKLDVREAAARLPDEADEPELLDEVEETADNVTDDSVEEVANAG